MEQTTTKRVKVVGTEEYINTRTGELEQMQVLASKTGTFNFTKMWMKNSSVPLILWEIRRHVCASGLSTTWTRKTV